MSGFKFVKLTEKQRKFADAYLETGNASEAARIAYDIKFKEVKDEKTGEVVKKSSAGAIGAQNLEKANIQEYLQQYSEGAVHRIEELSKDAMNESVRLAANRDILDRAGYKATENIDITSKGEKIDKIEQNVAQILYNKNPKNDGEKEKVLPQPGDVEAGE